MDRVLLALFFMVLPVMWLISLFWGLFQWLFIITCLCAVTLLWLRQGFTQRGRVVMTSFYALVMVFVLTGTLGSGGSGVKPPPVTTVPPINYQNQGYVTSGGNSVGMGLSASGGALTQGEAIPASGDASLAGLNLTGNPAATQNLTGGDAQQRPLSAAETVLEQFMQAWQSSIIANMVDLTAPSWRATLSASQNGPEQNLYWKFSNKKLDSWEFEGEPTGTDNDTSRTITVLATVSSSANERRQYRYSALMLQAEGQWYVDPNSLSTGTRVDNATPSPQEGADGSTVTPAPTPAPTKTPGPKTKLYYNKSGGKYYHADANCSSVAKEYLPLKGTFTYSQISKSPYDKLLRCTTCNAPLRP
jgi:hypothetical protein